MVVDDGENDNNWRDNLYNLLSLLKKNHERICLAFSVRVTKIEIGPFPRRVADSDSQKNPTQEGHFWDLPSWPIKKQTLVMWANESTVFDYKENFIR